MFCPLTFLSFPEVRAEMLFLTEENGILFTELLVLLSEAVQLSAETLHPSQLLFKILQLLYKSLLLGLPQLQGLLQGHFLSHVSIKETFTQTM